MVMTKDKAQKRAIRARMDKTGERYTTARRFHLDLHRTGATDGGPSPAETGVAEALANIAEPPAAAAPPARQADLGFSEAKIIKSTGKGWDEWLALLDAWEGTSHTHPEIARHVAEAYGIDAWWAQSVTVGYERARGMRAVHERPDGFSMNVSKTYPAPVERLFAAFVDADERGRWLRDVALERRTSQPHRSARFDVPPGATRLAAWFVSRGPEKSTVQLQHERLADGEDVARWKVLWKAQLANLGHYLGEERVR